MGLFDALQQPQPGAGGAAGAPAATDAGVAGMLRDPSVLMSMLGAAGGLLGADAPSRMPVGMSQVLSQGMGGGLSGMAMAQMLQQQQEREAREAQMDERLDDFFREQIRIMHGGAAPPGAAPQVAGAMPGPPSAMPGAMPGPPGAMLGGTAMAGMPGPRPLPGGGPRLGDATLARFAPPRAF